MEIPNYQPPSHYEIVLAKHTQSISLPQVKKNAIELMRQLDGWCSNEKACFLIDLIYKANPKIIVEIGVWGGKSLVPMAYALKCLEEGVIYGIDPWTSEESVKWVENEVNKEFWGSANHETILKNLKEKIKHFGLSNQIQLIRSTSENASPIFGIDMIHIDGNHSEYTCYLDVVKWVPLMNPGGWIILDDMTWCENGKFTETKAIEWLDQNCVRFADFSDTSKWGIWIKP